MRWLKKILSGIEVAVAALLLVCVVLSLAAVVIGLWHDVRAGVIFDAHKLVELLDGVLLVFVFVELFQTTVAYIEQHEVVRRVMEAALVVVARKLVTFEAGAETLPKAIGLGLLTVAVGVTWLLLKRAHAIEDD